MPAYSDRARFVRPDQVLAEARQRAGRGPIERRPTSGGASDEGPAEVLRRAREQVGTPRALSRRERQEAAEENLRRLGYPTATRRHQ